MPTTIVMRSLFFFTFAILVVAPGFAQKSFKRNTLYGEIAGNGLVLSVNYEKQLKDRPGLGLHIGIGLGGYKPVIPFGAKYLFEIGNHKSFLEAGAGIILAELEFLDDKENLYSEHNAYKAGFIPSIGYRHHTEYGLMWRINYTPVFSSYRSMLLYAGISIGWRL